MMIIKVFGVTFITVTDLGQDKQSDGHERFISIKVNFKKCTPSPPPFEPRIVSGKFEKHIVVSSDKSYEYTRIVLMVNKLTHNDVDKNSSNFRCSVVMMT